MQELTKKYIEKTLPAGFYYVSNGKKEAIAYFDGKLFFERASSIPQYLADTAEVKDFDGMAFKTMLRQLISKWGIMSIDMLTALESDMAKINENGKPDYVDDKKLIEADKAETPLAAQLPEHPAEQPQIEEDPFL